MAMFRGLTFHGWQLRKDYCSVILKFICILSMEYILHNKVTANLWNLQKSLYAHGILIAACLASYGYMYCRHSNNTKFRMKTSAVLCSLIETARGKAPVLTH